MPNFYLYCIFSNGTKKYINPHLRNLVPGHIVLERILVNYSMNAEKIKITLQIETLFLFVDFIHSVTV